MNGIIISLSKKLSNKTNRLYCFIYIILMIIGLLSCLAIPGTIINIKRAIILFILYISSIISFFSIQGSDPGYLNEDSIPLSLKEKLNINDINIQGLDLEIGLQSNVLYCDKCNIITPIRSHHCKICQKCVATFDHHCPVIATCIGERNHSKFYILLVTHLLVLWYGSYIIKHRLIEYTSIDPSWFKFYKDLAHLTSFIYGFLWFYVLLILLFHTWLILTSTTTYEVGARPEKLKYLHNSNKDVFDLPFSQGPIYNCYSTLCLRHEILGNNKDWHPILWNIMENKY